MSTFIGFISQKNSAKISKPPGGSSSDIFGADVATTPRSINNHMKSNIFGSPVDHKVSETRRPNQANSHARLFGDVEKSFPEAKQNYMKSSIPIGGSKNAENENANSDRNVVKKHEIAPEVKQIAAVDMHDSSSNQNKSKRVPPGGFASILW